jgi:hypothetical protein
MFKWFKKKEAKKEVVKAEKFDRVVARVRVYNKALAQPIAEYDFKQSEEHLIGGLHRVYPQDNYNISVIRY